jgi:hypothetical protein
MTLLSIRSLKGGSVSRARKSVLVFVVLGFAAAGVALSAGGRHETAGREVGIVRAGSSAEQAREHARASRTVTAATLGPKVGTAQFQGASAPVSSLPVIVAPVVTTLNARDNEHLVAAKGSSNAKDPVIQKKRGSGPLSAPIESFDGICLPFGPPCAEASSCSCLPPDTNGAVGDTQFVQMVNSDFAVYSKTGTVLRHATPIDALWSSAGGECAAHNDGDPVVVYDQFAKRWLLSEFVATPAAGEDYGECVAVSQTSDATGAYNLYFFDWGADTFLDYPHIGVWRDGYYLSANEFPTGQETSSGAAAIALERDKMLAGQPARYVWFDEAAANPVGGQYIGQLPADADGAKLPPAGAPDVFAEVDDPSGIPPTGSDLGFDLRLWKFHVDWADPASSTFGKAGQPSFTLPVAPFVRPQCTYGYGDCPLQKGGPQGLDALGDRLMFRLAYRNFGDHDSLVLNHTVKADTLEGIRWYEVRSPLTAPVITQQGTYAPDDSVTDPLSRWMGSIAMDKLGDVALGFSASGANDYPSVRYTGRTVGDPAGQMTQAEQVIYTGQGPQTEAEGRWGDYSELSVDPIDDCTFWYTQEYLTSDTVVLGSWATRIGAFRFPGCK